MISKKTRISQHSQVDLIQWSNDRYPVEDSDVEWSIRYTPYMDEFGEQIISLTRYEAMALARHLNSVLGGK